MTTATDDDFADLGNPRQRNIKDGAITSLCRIRLLLAYLWLTSAGISSAALPVTLTFDNLPSSSGELVPSGYGGLQWDNFYYVMGYGPAFSGSGFPHGVVSPSNVIYNGWGTPSLFSSSEPFDLHSAYLTSAWRAGLQVEVQGFVGATLAYDNTYTVNTTGPALLTFDYLGVNEVNFISFGGFPNTYEVGTQFVMDNLVVTVPEPSACALLGLGTAALMTCRRRK